LQAGKLFEHYELVFFIVKFINQCCVEWVVDWWDSGDGVAWIWREWVIVGDCYLEVVLDSFDDCGVVLV